MNKNKKNQYLGGFSCTMDKMAGMLKIKHKDLINAVPIMPCQNQLWIMSLRIYGEGTVQIPLSSPAT